MRYKLASVLTVFLAVGLPTAASPAPEEAPYLFTDPPEEIEHKLQSAREQLAAKLIEIVTSQPRPWKVAIHQIRMTKFRLSAGCDSFSVSSLYPEALSLIRDKLGDLEVSIIGDDFTEKAKERVLSPQARILWDEQGIVAPETSMKVGEASGARIVILLEPEEIWIYPDRDVVLAEARAMDTNANVVLGEATVSVELQHHKECLPFPSRKSLPRSS